MHTTTEKLRTLLIAAQDAIRVLLYMTPDQFAQHRAEIKELGQALRDAVDNIEESPNDN